MGGLITKKRSLGTVSLVKVSRGIVLHHKNIKLATQDENVRDSA